MKRYGKFITTKRADVDEIIVTTSDENIHSDKMLRRLNFYPIDEVGEPHLESNNRRFKYSFVNDKNGGHIEQRTVVIPVTKTYSKLKILMGARRCGFLDQLIQFLNSNIQLKMIWDASNVIEDNELLSQYLPEIARGLGTGEQELRNFLNTYCIAD